MSIHIRMADPDADDTILHLQTVQISPFRTLMTALKDILLETNITFTPEGIKIINMDLDPTHRKTDLKLQF